MKRVIIIMFTLLLSSCIPLPAQTTDYKEIYSYQPIVKIDAVSFVFSPISEVTGFKVDYHVNSVGLYSSIAYGEWELYKDIHIKKNIKVTTGTSINMYEEKDFKSLLLAGITYQYLGKKTINSYQNYNIEIYNPWSFELGIAEKIKCFLISARIDVLHWEPCIDIGINF